VRLWNYSWNSYIHERHELRVVDQQGKQTVEHYSRYVPALMAWRAKRKELLGPYIAARKQARDSTCVTAHEVALVVERLRKAQEELDAY
jgi:uncharacterized protein YbgA (DUF1722 family)